LMNISVSLEKEVDLENNLERSTQTLVLKLTNFSLQENKRSPTTSNASFMDWTGWSAWKIGAIATAGAAALLLVGLISTIFKKKKNLFSISLLLYNRISKNQTINFIYLFVFFQILAALFLCRKRRGVQPKADSIYSVPDRWDSLSLHYIDNPTEFLKGSWEELSDDSYLACLEKEIAKRLNCVHAYQNPVVNSCELKLDRIA
ncbi:hypothetical protein T10_1856, partial [Trichinella papuae]